MLPLTIQQKTMQLIRFFSLFFIIIPTFVNSSFRKVPHSSYYLQQGLDLELPCIAEKRNVNCYWTKKGNIIPPRPDKYNYHFTSTTGDCSLKIINLTFPIDNDTWQCQIPQDDNPTKTDWPVTNVIVLITPSEPVINYDNLTNSFIADQSTDISCRSFNGNPPPQLEWYLDGLNITQFANLTIENQAVTSRLNYTFKRRDNGSRLACKVVHKTGQQTATQILDVQYKPYVSVHQKSYTVYEGNDLEIECYVEANPKAKIFWKPTVKIDESLYIVKESKLLLPKLNHSLDGIEFQCSAQNNVGQSETESVKLSVLYAPILMDIHYPRKNITVGDDIEIECKFAGNPEPTIRWSFTDSIRNELHNPVPTMKNSGKLVIKNASYLDEGDYYCQGINYNSLLSKENTTPSTKISINIVGKPLFIEERKVVNGYRGLNTKIEQSFCSDPLPEKIYWQFGSSRINVDIHEDNNNNDIEYRQGDLEPAIPFLPNNNRIETGRLMKFDLYSPNPTCFTVALVIRNTDTEDIRDYTLTVHNKYGKGEGIVALQVNSPLSVAAVIAFALIFIIIAMALTTGIVLLRKRSSNSKHLVDPEIEGKAEVQVPINDKTQRNGH